MVRRINMDEDSKGGLKTPVKV